MKSFSKTNKKVQPFQKDFVFKDDKDKDKDKVKVKVKVKVKDKNKDKNMDYILVLKNIFHFNCEYHHEILLWGASKGCQILS